MKVPTIWPAAGFRHPERREGSHEAFGEHITTRAMDRVMEEIAVFARVGLEVEELAPALVCLRVERQTPGIGHDGVVVLAPVDARMNSRNRARVRGRRPRTQVRASSRPWAPGTSALRVPEWSE